MERENKTQAKVVNPSIPNTKMREFIDEKGCNKPFDEFLEKLVTDDIKKAEEYEKLLERGFHKTYTQESKYVQEVEDGKSNVKTENKKKLVEVPLTDEERASYIAFMEKIKPVYSEYKKISKTIKKNKTKFTKHSIIILTKFIERFLTDIIKESLLLCNKDHKTVKKEFVFNEQFENKWFYPYLCATRFATDKVKYLSDLEWSAKMKDVYDNIAKKVVESEDFIKDFDSKTLKKLESKLKSFNIKPAQKKVVESEVVVTEKTTTLFVPFIKNTIKKVKTEMLDGKEDKPKFPTLQPFKEYLDEIAMELMNKVVDNLILTLKATDKNNVSNSLMENAIDLITSSSFVANTITIEKVNVLDPEDKKRIYADAKAKTTSGKVVPDYSNCKTVEEYSITKQLHMGGVNVAQVLDLTTLLAKK